jgi:hypothetical protein
MSQRDPRLASGGIPIRGEILRRAISRAQVNLESGRKPLGSLFRESRMGAIVPCVGTVVQRQGQMSCEKTGATKYGF